MEVVKRKICLEDFKSRCNSSFGYEDGDWGKIAYDITVTNNSPLIDLRDELPLIENVGEILENGQYRRNQLQFHRLLFWYRWINEFIESTIFYKKCKRKEGENINTKWVEVESDFYESNNIEFFSSLRNIPDDIEYGEVIAVNDKSDEFNRIFRRDNSVIRYEMTLLILAEEVFSGQYRHTATPYINLPININTTYDSLGCYDNYIKKWDGSKVYPVGDTVMFYDENKRIWECYKLITGNDIELIELTGELYNFYNKQYNKELYEVEYKNILNNSNKKNEYIQNGVTKNNKPLLFKEGEKWYLPSIVYKARYSEVTGEYVFNESNTIYWEKVVSTDGDAENVVAIGESKLNSLIRDKRSVDEDGNILPFIINNTGSSKTELQYGMGYTNHILTNNDEIYFDSLDKMEIYNEEGVKVKTLEYIINEEGKNIRITDENGNQTQTGTYAISCALFPIKGRVEIEYRIGVIMTDEREVVSGSGVKYRETYNFEKVSEAFNVKLNRYPSGYPILSLVDYSGDEEIDENTTPTWYDNLMVKSNIGKIYKEEDNDGNIKFKQLLSSYTYIKFDYESKKTEIINEYLDSKIENVILSEMEYGGISVSDDNFIKSNIFKNPLTIGLEDKKENININVERGTSSAFELHHILSEVNTLQDLENYRNNLFKL